MFNSPMSTQRAEGLIQALQLSAKSKVVDLGCGDGAFLKRMALQYPIDAIGVDTNEVLIEVAKQPTSATNIQGQVNFVCSDAAEYATQLSAIDAIVCIGSEFIFGGYRALLQKTRQSLNNTGKLLVGTVYWKQQPASDYLALMNGENPHFDLETTVRIAYDEGYLPLGVFRSNDDEWDAFESYHAQKRYESGLTSEQVVMLERAWTWQRGYIKWGMATMGFCFLILQKHTDT